jgi:hypothetical protein
MKRFMTAALAAEYLVRRYRFRGRRWSFQQMVKPDTPECAPVSISVARELPHI